MEVTAHHKSVFIEQLLPCEGQLMNHETHTKLLNLNEDSEHFLRKRTNF